MPFIGAYCTCGTQQNFGALSHSAPNVSFRSLLNSCSLFPCRCNFSFK